MCSNKEEDGGEKMQMPEIQEKRIDQLHIIASFT
jgi:hypothetical protein